MMSIFIFQRIKSIAMNRGFFQKQTISELKNKAFNSTVKSNVLANKIGKTILFTNGNFLVIAPSTRSVNAMLFLN